MKRTLILATILMFSAGALLAQDELEDPTMDDPIEALEPVESINVEVSVSPINVVEPQQVTVGNLSPMQAVESNLVEVASILMIELVDQTEITIETIKQMPLAKQFDAPIYDLFNSGKMKWVAKRLKIAEAEGKEEEAAKLRLQLANMVREWINEKDLNTPPHD